jgi:hypothetical protein
VLGVAAGDRDRCHGDEGGSEEHEDASLDALEGPVPAGGLVGDQHAVSASSQAGSELARTLEHECLARGRHAADGDAHAAEGNVDPAVGLAACYLAARANYTSRDQPVGPWWHNRAVEEAEGLGERGHVVRVPDLYSIFGV